MKEVLSDCTKFVEIKEDWKTLLFRYQDKVSRIVYKLKKYSSLGDDEKKVNNSGSTSRKRYGLPKFQKSRL